MKNTITCTKCGAEIELSESLASPFVESVRQELSGKLSLANEEARLAKEQLAKERSAILLEKEALEAEVAKRVAEQRSKVAELVRQELAEESKAELESKDRRIDNLLAQLGTAKENELKLEEEKQALALREQSISLEITKGVTAKLNDIRTEAERKADEEYRLKIAELNKKIEDMDEKLEEARRKGSQGSQQLQGEVLELELEAALTASFPWDEVAEVKKGQRGADCVQSVMSAPGRPAGKILWEAKRSQNWGADWISKLKNDARETDADLWVIVSEVLPKGIESFGQVEGVWVCKPGFAVPLAYALREALVQIYVARQSAAGKETSAHLIYDYVTGQAFRNRLEGIAEPFKQLQDDLAAERRLAEQRFARRQKWIDRALKACYGMAGDLHGLAGPEMGQLESFELAALEPGASDSDAEKED